MAVSIDSLLYKGQQARKDKRLIEARSAFQEAVILCRDAGNDPLLAQALARLGGIERDLGNPQQALERYQQAAAIHRTLEKPFNLAHTVRHVGDIALELRPPDLALSQSSFEEAINLYRSHPDTTPLDLANTLRGYALLLTAQENTQRAIEAWTEAAALYQQADIPAGVAECNRRIATLTTN